MSLFLLNQPPNRHNTQQQTAQAKKSQLAIVQAQNLQNGLTPGGWRHKGHEALNDQHQSDGEPESGAIQTRVHVYFLPATAGPLPRMVLKKSELLGSSTITSLFLEKLAL